MQTDELIHMTPLYWRRKCSLRTRALLHEWALATLRATGMTNQAPELDKVHMKGILTLGGHEVFQQLLGFDGVLGCHKPQPVGHPADVGIDGHYRHAKGKQQYTGGCFGANPRMVGQPGLGIAGWHLGQEIQRKYAVIRG